MWLLQKTMWSRPKTTKLELPCDPGTPYRETTQSRSYVKCKKAKHTEAESRTSATKSWGCTWGEVAQKQ